MAIQAEQCRSCGAPLKWIKSANGKWMPCDAKSTSVVMATGQVVIGHQSHFATCPDAGKWRKPKEGQHGEG